MTEFIDSDGDDDIVALIFDHKPASPKTSPSGRKNSDSRASPKTSPTARKSIDSRASPTIPPRTASRTTSSPPKNDTQTRRSPPTPNSQLIANERYAAMIDSMLGAEPEMSGKKLKLLLRNFALFEPEIAAKVENAVKIDEDRFDVAKLKELLVAAATEPGDSKLAKRIRPSVIAALSNRPPSPWYRQKPVTKKASPRQSPTAKTQKVASPAKGDSAESYDADEEPSRQQTSPKKRVSPGKASPKGEKYFPGFYDNIDY